MCWPKYTFRDFYIIYVLRNTVCYLYRMRVKAALVLVTGTVATFDDTAPIWSDRLYRGLVLRHLSLQREYNINDQTWDT